MMGSKTMQGFAIGILCVAAFSLTLPLTKYLVLVQDSIQVGLFRSLIAAIIALFILIIFAKRFPTIFQLKRLAIVSVPIALGFPILTAFSMDYLSSSYGAVILSCLPIVTAVFGTLIGKERQSLYFWLLSGISLILVIAYSMSHSPFNQFGFGDITLFIAVLCAGLGYAQGGALAKEMHGWEVICWSLLLSLPFLILFSYLNLNWDHLLTLNFPHWLALLYLGLINSLFGFFFWYKALALGGIVKISQIQLLQPFFTYFISIVFLGENFNNNIIILFFLLTIIIFKIKNA